MSSQSVETFDVTAPWRLSESVSLRDESFGALAYHHVTRRLVFLKSRALVDIVRELDRFDSAIGAIEKFAPRAEVDAYARALSSLKKSEIIHER